MQWTQGICTLFTWSLNQASNKLSTFSSIITNSLFESVRLCMGSWGVVGLHRRSVGFGAVVEFEDIFIGYVFEEGLFNSCMLS